jgi:hypothetical protein
MIKISMMSRIKIMQIIILIKNKLSSISIRLLSCLHLGFQMMEINNYYYRMHQNK